MSQWIADETMKEETVVKEEMVEDLESFQSLHKGISVVSTSGSETLPQVPRPVITVKDFRIPPAPTGLVTSSTSSPPGSNCMRPPPPPPPPRQPRTSGYVEVKQERTDRERHPHEEPSSSIPDLEFDGTTVLCRVCGDKASGFHYGVHSCEGCKGFFRRSIQQKIQYRPCTKNQQCSILRINRNRCQYCRLKKCIAVGMSRDAVRFGRVPKREKARILAAMQQSTNSRSQEKAVAAELEDEQRLLGTVIRAHLDTCDFTKDKIEPMIARARDQPSYTACPPTLACPLNPNPQPLSGQQELLQDFSKRFSPAIRGVVEFAKRIPGFSLLPQDDQVTLLKAGVFEVLLVRLACMFDAQTNSMICLNGQVLKRESIHNTSNARFLMDSMFDFADRINSLGLSDAEIGLFCSVVVIAADRPGLRNTDLIERMHNKLRNALQAVVTQNHPGHSDICNELMKKIPDLRTLNTLHSEKLLAFKMTEQQQLQQQQQQQQQLQQQEMWAEEEAHSKSPAGSSWSSSSDVTMDEAVKSPLGSVSSTESVCSGEVAALTDHQGGPASSAPLLAATLAGGVCPHRHRANSGSTSGDDDMMATHLLQNGLTITAVNNPSKSYNQSHRFQRKLDSPSDSGIESGTEKIDKVTNSVNSAPTSLCSSPRSSLEDKDEEKQHSHIVEDMPVLKRVLQAPPLYDTNSLMDEAYKPHKKFRALRNKDSAEAEPMIVVSPVPSLSSPEHHSSPQLHRHLTATASAPPALTSHPNHLAPHPPHSAHPAHASHPSLAASLSASPAPHAPNPASANPHTPAPSPTPAPAPAPAPSFASPLSTSHSTLVSTLTSNHPAGHPSGSSLSSTHSTLAKSLMEGPRMTAEQVKRQEIIHNYIMRGDPSPAPEFPTSRPNALLASPQSQSGYHYLPTQPQPSRWHSNGASVITTSRPFSIAPNSTSSPPPALQKPLDQPPSEFSRIYLQPQSPHRASSSTSPAPLARNASPCSPCTRSPALSLPLPLPLPLSNPLPGSSPKMMELQVDIADSNQQPLNLSKKSPSPSPRPLSAPSTTVQKALTLEA